MKFEDLPAPEPEQGEADASEPLTNNSQPAASNTSEAIESPADTQSLADIPPDAEMDDATLTCWNGQRFVSWETWERSQQGATPHPLPDDDQHIAAEHIRYWLRAQQEAAAAWARWQRWRRENSAAADQWRNAHRNENGDWRWLLEAAKPRDDEGRASVGWALGNVRPIEPAAAPEVCSWCDGRRFWKKRGSGDIFCAQCHPAPSEDSVAEWIESKSAPEARKRRAWTDDEPTAWRLNYPATQIEIDGYEPFEGRWLAQYLDRAIGKRYSIGTTSEAKVFVLCLNDSDRSLTLEWFQNAQAVEQSNLPSSLKDAAKDTNNAGPKRNPKKTASSRPDDEGKRLTWDQRLELLATKPPGDPPTAPCSTCGRGQFWLPEAEIKEIFGREYLCSKCAPPPKPVGASEFVARWWYVSK